MYTMSDSKCKTISWVSNIIIIFDSVVPSVLARVQPSVDTRQTRNSLPSKTFGMKIDTIRYGPTRGSQIRLKIRSWASPDRVDGCMGRANGKQREQIDSTQTSLFSCRRRTLHAISMRFDRSFLTLFAWRVRH